MTAAQKAYDTIRAAIVDGTHLPGTMLSENELAAALGLSRTPIRSALVRLQDDGWITIYPQRGALVVGLDPFEVADLADARYVLEVTGVQRASFSQRETLARDLTALVDVQERALGDRDIQAFVASTIQFHRGFVVIGGNKFFVEAGDRLVDRQRLLLFAQREHIFERSVDLIDEHRRLLKQLTVENLTDFAATLRAHIVDTHGPGIGPL